jgi:hypothetical protein
MKVADLAAKMYNAHRLGDSFLGYSDEELLAVLNFNREMSNFFNKTHNSMLVYGLSNMEAQLLTVLKARGKNI